MATRKTNTAPPKSNAGIIAPISAVAALVATVMGLPGFAILWIGLIVASFTTVPPQLTGKTLKGEPDPANDMEAEELRKYRFWTEFRKQAFFPSDILPFAEGKTWSERLRLSAIWLVAAGAALVAFAAPVSAGIFFAMPLELAPYVELFRVLNVVGAFLAPLAFTGALRKSSDPQDIQPRVSFHSNIVLTVIAPVVGLVLGFVAMAAPAVVERIVDEPGYTFPVEPVWAFALGVFLAVSGGIAYLANRASSLVDWMERKQARETWKMVLMQLKVDPRLTDHRVIGDGIVLDAFTAPGIPNAEGMIALAPKLIPLLGAGLRGVMLNVPNEGSDGSPLPGTKHPMNYEVAQWPEGSIPDFRGIIDQDVAELAIRSAAAWAHDAERLPRPDLVGLRRVSTDSSPTHAWLASFLGEGAMYLDTTGSAIGRELNGVDAFPEQGNGTIDVYLGDLDNSELEDESLRERMDMAAATARWKRRWTDALKQGVQVPTLQSQVYRSSRLADGTLIEYQPFVFNQGVAGAKAYFGHEANLSTTLDAAPFVAITGFPPPNGRPGERFPQAMAVAWAKKTVPTSPTKLDPAGERDALRWVLAGMVNRAFAEAKLAQPELANATALTMKGSPNERPKPHIWKLDVRLYDGVTMEDVKKHAGRIALALRVEWLRITDYPDGVTIVAGANPNSKGIEFARTPPRAEYPSWLAYCMSLDWEQAFKDAKVLGSGSTVPKLTNTSTLPKNDDVQVLRFELPPGVTRGSVSEAREKLMTSTNNAFLLVRPTKKANEVELLVASENPLKSSIPVAWNEVAEAKAIAFGSTIEGDVAYYDWTTDPHLLILGGSGSGKSATLQVLMTGALFMGADVYVADPSKGAADFRFAEKYLKAVIVDTVEASAMMNAVYAEVIRRKNLNSKYGVDGYRKLPDEVRPPHMVVIIDEFTSLMMADRLKKPATNDPEVLAEYEEQVTINDAKANIGSKAGRIAREARSAGVTLFLATQKLTSDTLSSIPGAGDLKTNLSRLLLGKTTFGDLQAGLRSPTEAPDIGSQVNAGRGIYETTLDASVIVQGWYEPGTPGSLLAKLEENGIPEVTEKLDVTPFMPKKDNVGVAFSVVGNGPAAMSPVAPAEAPAEEIVLDDMDLSDEVVDLGEMDLSDMDLSDFVDDELDADSIEVPMPEATVETDEDDFVVPMPDVPVVAEVEEDYSDIEVIEPTPTPDYEPDYSLPTVTTDERTIGEDLFLSGEPRSSEYDWPMLDLLREWLSVYEAPRKVTWLDPMLNERDYFDILYSEHAEALLRAAGVTEVVLPTPVAEPEHVEVTGVAYAHDPDEVDDSTVGDEDYFETVLSQIEAAVVPAAQVEAEVEEAPAPAPEPAEKPRRLTPSELAAARAAKKKAKEESDALFETSVKAPPSYDGLFD